MPGEQAAADSAAHFTQVFYDWYISQGAHLETAIRDSAVLFSPELLSALRADVEAQARDSEYVVGLDWDPLLGSQDPCASYRVGQTRREANLFHVEVFGVCPDADRGRPASTPDVVAEVIRRQGSWVFVNFRHGADSGDLLTDLARLRAERDSSAARDHR